MNTKFKACVFALVISITFCFYSIQAFAQGTEMTPISGIPMIEDIKPLSIGDKVPQFIVNDVTGKEFDTTKQIGKKVYLFVFWSIFCEPCKEEMPLIKLVAAEYSKDKLGVVAINLDGAPFKNAIIEYSKDGGFDFRFIIDELDDEEFFKIADPYGVAGTPTIYIIDKKGQVKFSVVGKVKKSTLKEALDSVLND